ncbi:glycosyltransferase family 2 protein [Bifidobacterium moukalabense]|uniref:glycosyltransferase family 2 protein n=1 Tax=Bifidobacterium moukalabense TaxID=1333651 RepID=UPI0010F89302|nr:glycosyltransferase family 2 protein [Bifidobacterium moukalabense]
MCEKSAASVDILMATYNGEKYVGEQIESIQAQSFNNWRLLISDDCSSDDTLEIVKKYAEQDPRIIVVSQGKRYGSAKLNFMSLLTAADAPYVMFCDQDDVWLPKKIELTLAKMYELEQLHPREQPLLVFTDMKVVGEDLHILDESFERYSQIDSSRTSFNQILAQSVGAGCTMMCNHVLKELLQGTSHSAYMIMHDWWISLIAASMGSIGHVSQATSLYRQHEDNSVGASHFSPFERMLHLERMRQSFQKTLKQAESFKEVFGSKLSEKNLETVKIYAQIRHVNGIIGVLNLCRCGCWKSGTRAAGQIICSALPKK